ncbi:MAG: ATP-binding cassette domain-containing protein [Aquabacterium sp.]|nr:ATP-binding cassette domain-containing protein [Aquabacterium sp.]
MSPEVPPVVDLFGLRYARPTEGDGQPPFVLELPALTLKRGEALALVGPSGCGKSTVIDLLALLRRPSTVERLRLLDHDVGALWAAGDTDACTALRARHVGVVLQTGGLLPALPAIENVLLSQRLLGELDLAWTTHLMHRLDLAGLERRRPQQLSVGQRQRMAIARALAHRPALVLADEPTAALGPEHGPSAVALMRDLAVEGGSAVLVVSHDRALLDGLGIPALACRVRNGVARVEAP